MKYTNISSPINRKLAAAVVAALIVATPYGCQPKGAQDKGVFRIIGVDTSGSAQHDMDKYRSITYRLVHELRPEKDAVRVLRFDYEPYEILSTVGQKREDLLSTLVKQLRVPAERRGTRTGRFFQRVAELLGSPEARGRRIEIYVATDNGNDDASPAMSKVYEASTRKIAADSRVSRICYWGVKTRFREQIPAAFTRLPESVLTVHGDTEEFARR